MLPPLSILILVKAVLSLYNFYQQLWNMYLYILVHTRTNTTCIFCWAQIARIFCVFIYLFLLLMLVYAFLKPVIILPLALYSIPFCAILASRAVRCFFKLFKSCQSYMNFTPSGEPIIPCLLSLFFARLILLPCLILIFLLCDYSIWH